MVRKRVSSACSLVSMTCAIALSDRRIEADPGGVLPACRCPQAFPLSCFRDSHLATAIGRAISRAKNRP